MAKCNQCGEAIKGKGVKWKKDIHDRQKRFCNETCETKYATKIHIEQLKGEWHKC